MIEEHEMKRVLKECSEIAVEVPEILVSETPVVQLDDDRMFVVLLLHLHQEVVAKANLNLTACLRFQSRMIDLVFLCLKLLMGR